MFYRTYRRQVQEVMKVWMRGFPAEKERDGWTCVMLLGWIHGWGRDKLFDERFWTKDLSQLILVVCYV